MRRQKGKNAFPKARDENVTQDFLDTHTGVRTTGDALEAVANHFGCEINGEEA